MNEKTGGGGIKSGCVMERKYERRRKRYKLRV